MLDVRSIALSRIRLEKAHKEYETAIFNKDAGFFDTANNRAYYAIFHSMRAVLALDGVDFKTHGHVIGYFNKYYINTELIERSFSEAIYSAFQSRTISDYEDTYKATAEEAEKNIIGAKKLLMAIERYIEIRLEAVHIQDEEHN
jgi:uncharacterized protein (UPF0332 family)